MKFLYSQGSCVIRRTVGRGQSEGNDVQTNPDRLPRGGGPRGPSCHSPESAGEKPPGQGLRGQCRSYLGAGVVGSALALTGTALGL